MKYYTIRVLTNTDDKRILIGYTGFDQASGGYPYVNTFPVFSLLETVEHEMSLIAETKTMLDMDSHDILFPSCTHIYVESFSRALGYKSYKETDAITIAIRFEMIEVDMSDIMNIRSRLIREIEVEGREANEWKQRSSAYYKIVSDTRK